MQPDMTIAEAVAEIDRLATENADLRRRLAQREGEMAGLHSALAVAKARDLGA
jgi:threonine synthase